MDTNIKIGQNHRIELIKWKDISRTLCLRIYQFHNDVKQAMIGREVYYLTKDATSDPVDYIRFTLDIGGIGSTSSVKTTINDTDDYYTEWLASYTNSGGTSLDITKVELTNTSSVVYGDETVAVTLATGEVLDCYYTHTWTLDTGSHSDYLDSNIIEHIQDCFETATVTKPIKSFRAVLSPSPSGTDVDFYFKPTIDDGGSVDDTNTVWTAYMENTSAVGTISRFGAGTLAYSNLAGADDTYFDETGLSEAWAYGQTIEATFTITWSETV